MRREIEKDDLDLVDKIIKGDRRDLREIYDRYNIQLYFVVKRYLKNTELSEDAVQDIFVMFWTKRDHLNPNLSFEGYLFTALKNHVLNMVRDDSLRKNI